MTLTDRPIKRSDLEIHEVEDGCVVFVPSTDDVHFLNATAMFVLHLCDGEHVVSDIQAELGDPSAIGFDVRSAILEQFERAGIIILNSGEVPRA